jgi:D-3-phosphoglycerate dehydrogenase / 2-oxoglutarate reductase
MTRSALPRVLVADPLSPGGLDLLRLQADVVVASDAPPLQRDLESSDALIVRSRTNVTADLMDRGPRLRVIGRAGIGVDNIDVDAATQRGILVINAPLGNVRSTAEHTMALVFAMARRIVAADRAVRDATWKQAYEGTQLLGKRIGVIGAGKVGRLVVSMASALGMDVVVHDPYLPQEMLVELGVPNAGLRELLSTSDFVTLHVPLNVETRGLIGHRELEIMQTGSYLVNCARGGLVDEVALAANLVSGRLAGAALDVFEDEPLHDSPLLAAPNTVLTPHVAASTKEAQAQVSTDIAGQVLDFFAGKAVRHPVNPGVVRKAGRV